MTNTDRLAQALRECLARLLDTEHNGTEAKDPVPAIRKGRAALAEYEATRAALASLAPAAVEGDAWNEAALFVNNCENTYEESTQLWRRVTSGEGHDMVAFQTPVAHAMQQCLRNVRKVVFAVNENTDAKVSALTAQVAALTAQCEGLRKEVLSVADDLDARWGNPESATNVMAYTKRLRAAIAAGNGEGAT